MPGTKVEKIVKMEPKIYAKINGKEFIAWSLIEILDELQGTDGFMIRLVIDDLDTGRLLADLGIASQTARGGYFCKNEKKRKQLSDKLYKFFEKDDNEN